MAASAGSRPNILLIMTDQQRRDSLGCYGNTFTHTPHVDRLAREGARFEQSYTPWPVCTPARATMWTGVYPHAHKVIENVYGVENALAAASGIKGTLFSALRSAGYATAYFGKWHLGEADPGTFDVWRGFNSAGGHWTEGARDTTYKPDVQTDQSIAFLEEQASHDDPFLIVQAYYPPHQPYTAPRRFMYRYRDLGVPFPGYYAAVDAIDENVGRILEALDATGKAENTLVIFYSDHGETFNYRRESRNKFVCYDESIRIPFIVRWPGHVAPGSAPGQFMGLQDLMPTLLEVAGVEPPHPMHGRSLVPLLKAEAPAWREAYYVENTTILGTEGLRILHGRIQRCLRTPEWKLILSEDRSGELYYLKDDPEEELNLYVTPRTDPHHQFLHLPSYASVVLDLARKLGSYAKEIGDPVGVEFADTAIRAAADRLQAAAASSGGGA